MKPLICTRRLLERGGRLEAADPLIKVRALLVSRCTQIADLFPFLFNIVRVFTAKSLH
jgi:hypothetical protein